jgi:putative DNA primase/helicase
MNAAHFDPHKFPSALTELPQWVCWRVEERQGKPTKVPVSARTGRPALANAPSTWGAFEEVLSYARSNGHGVGFVFSEHDPFAGVDLDDCIDPETRAVAPWAWAIVARLNSYSEVSPSGLGVKVFVRAALPEGRRGWGSGHGMYDRCRFFTMTGARFPGLPETVEERQAEIAALHAEQFPPLQAKPATSGPMPIRNLSDADVLHRAMSAANGTKFSRLWCGDRGGYTSDSEADAALCAMIAWWTGPDADRIDQLFRQSRLVRGKWDRASYRDKTIALALTRTEYYDPNRKHSPTARRLVLSDTRRAS